MNYSKYRIVVADLLILAWLVDINLYVLNLYMHTISSSDASFKTDTSMK